MGASMTGWTTRVLPTVALAGAVLLGGCQSTGTPTAPAASTGADAAATSPAPTTSGAPTASSASSPGTPLGVFEVTCHTGPGVTASGRPSSREVVSVDRRLFPFGTRLWTVRGTFRSGPTRRRRLRRPWSPRPRPAGQVVQVPVHADRRLTVRGQRVELLPEG